MWTYFSIDQCTVVEANTLKSNAKIKRTIRSTPYIINTECTLMSYTVKVAGLLLRLNIERTIVNSENEVECDPACNMESRVSFWFLHDRAPRPQRSRKVSYAKGVSFKLIKPISTWRQKHRRIMRVSCNATISVRSTTQAAQISAPHAGHLCTAICS